MQRNRQSTIGAALVSLIVTAVLAFAPIGVHAEIYKVIDKDGNVVFTDVPPKDKSAPVTLSQPNQYSNSDTAPAPPPTVVLTPDTDSEEAEAISYEGLEIVSPLNDAAVRENAGNVVIQVTMEPQYDPTSGYQVQLMMDGELVSTAYSTQHRLENVDRGTHVIVANLIDELGRVVATSAPSTFHLLRYSALNVRPNN